MYEYLFPDVIYSNDDRSFLKQCISLEKSQDAYSRFHRLKEEEKQAWMLSAALAVLYRYGCEEEISLAFSMASKVDHRPTVFQLDSIMGEETDVFSLMNRIRSFLSLNCDRTSIGGVIDEISIKPYRGKEEPLLLFQFPEKATITMELVYCSRIFNEETAKRFLDRLALVIKQMDEKQESVPSRLLIGDLHFLLLGEKEQILNQFNSPCVPVQRRETLISLVEKSCRQFPKEVAIFDEERSITYSQLQENVDRMARILLEHGIERGDFVAIIMERSIECIVSLLATMRVGAAYVPMDPLAPQERLLNMVQDCQPKALLVGDTPIPTLLSDTYKVLNVLQEKEDESHASLDIPVYPDDLAYVIYTSGTTGRPKGVMVEHHGVVNVINFLKKKYALTHKDNILQFANIVFDASVWEIFAALCHGATLVLAKDRLNTKATTDLIRNQDISILVLPPNYFTLLKELSPRVMVTAGSASNHNVLMNIHDSRYFNGYGPTEASIQTTQWEWTGGVLPKGRIPIGKPIANVQVYVMHNDKLCGIGIPGEIMIAGEGLARGYLNRDELTAEKFVQNPFGPGKMYHSGDLARWNNEGELEYLGRIDEQVKIRGFRIELGEIEHALRQIEGIKESACIVQGSVENEQWITAYLEGSCTLSEEEIKDRIQQTLPEYMIPSHIFILDHLPVNSSGKIDKKSLAKLRDETQEKENHYIAPGNEIESILCGFFAQILHLSSVSVDQDFFNAGGHSLRAIQLVHRINTSLGLTIPVSVIFSHSTPRNLAIFLAEQKTREAIKPKVEKKLPQPKLAQYYPLSAAQKRIVLETEFGTEGLAYNNPLWFRFRGKLDHARLSRALEAMIQRHEILRTRFVFVQGHPMQEILDRIDLPLTFFSVDGSLPDEEMVGDANTKTNKRTKNNFFIKQWQKKLVKPFSLEKGPLFRIALIETEEETYLFLDFHHSIIDGMSMVVFIEEFSALYSGKTTLAEPSQYTSYSEWMRMRDDTDALHEWIADLSPLPEPLDIVTDFSRPIARTDRGGMVDADLSEEIELRMRKICQEQGMTPYMLFFSALAVYLSKLGRSEDFLIGSPFSARTHPDTERMLGMFVNTLPLRVRPKLEENFLDLVNETRKYLLEVYERQDFPFDELVSALKLKRDPTHHPLFDVLFVFQNNEMMKADFDGQKGELVDGEHSTAKFDLTFYVDETEKGHKLRLEYNTDLFRPDTAQRLLEQYRYILRQVLAFPEKRLEEFDTAMPEERENILGPWNDTVASYPEKKTLVDLFVEQVKKSPQRPAVRFKNNTISYEMLYDQAVAVCRLLQRHHVQAGDFVALYVQRSTEMIAAILGILFAGASYVPINTMYPEERVRFILKDSQAKIVLLGNIPLPIEAPCPALKIAEAEENKIGEIQFTSILPESCAYVIYTSGTSGKPKGVMVSHRNVVRLLFNDHLPFDFNETDIWTLFHSYGFDFSVWEMYGALLYGGCLVIVPEEVAKNAEAFYALLKKERVTVLNQVPSSFYVLSPFVKKEDTLAVRYLIFGGEALTPAKVCSWHDHVPGCKIINMYGITETTVHVTYQEITDKEMNAAGSPIGHPIPTMQTYIMQKDALCGVGIPGELCVGGDGVSLGYLNREDLNAQRFVPNPFGKGKLYRSGDLARYLPDGRMEFLGRIDQQVKIRGFRIELGEIEEAFRAQPEISEVAVIAKKEYEDTCLCAYLVGKKTIRIGELKEKLRRRLPAYMVPSYVMQIKELPLTPNGKLDRRALPEIIIQTEEKYFPPESESEKLVSHLFEKLLTVEKVGKTDNFFELGGHSLKAAELVYGIEEATGKKIRLSSIFEAPDVASLARLLDNTDCLTMPSPAEEAPTDHLDCFLMSSRQLRVYLATQRDPNGLSYNMPEVFSIEGVLDEDRLQDALQEISSRHTILRTDYIFTEEVGQQRIHDDILLDFSVTNLMDSSRKEAAFHMDKFILPFDLEQAPLWRVRLLHCMDGDLLFIDMHHIISDGVSLQLFYRELSDIYEGKKVFAPHYQYSDIVKKGWTEENENDLEYWCSLFREEIPVLELALDEPRPKVQSFQGAICTSFLSKQDSERLRSFAKRNNISPYMAFLAGIMILLSRYTRQEKIVVGSPFSGRTRPEMQAVLGMFVNVLPLVARPERDKTLGFFLQELRKATALANEHQNVNFDHLVEKVLSVRDPSRNPLFDVVLSVQSQEGEMDRLASFATERLSSVERIAKFDLTFNVTEIKGAYRIEVQYATALFRESSIQVMLDHYRTLLESIIVANSDDHLYSLPMLSDEEKYKIVKIWNTTQSPYPREESITSTFYRQTEKTPNAIALIEGNDRWTYQQVVRAANRLSKDLVNSGVQRGDYIGIMAERRARTIIAKLAILNCGAAYVAINPSYPEERIRMIIEDCQSPLLLLQGEKIHVSCPTLDITEMLIKPSLLDSRNECADENVNNGLSEIRNTVAPDDIAALIYTSGTTGRPKGVRITHRNILNLINNQEAFGLVQPHAMAQTGQMSFDASLYELWGTLLFGGSVHLIPETMILDPFALGQYVQKNRINCLFLTTALFNQYAMETPELFSSLKHVLTGGERISDYAFKRVHHLYPKLTICNAYGPTENTTITTVYKAGSSDWTRTPIGRPLNNIRVYTVDSYGHLVGIGVPGELWIGGDSLTPGYLGRDALNQEKFVTASFDPKPLYRTGDIARFLPDGQIDFLGRIDQQVKIRGFRIEPGEVEHILRGLEQVRDCAVIARRDVKGEMALYAYVVLQEEKQLTKEKVGSNSNQIQVIKDKLSANLPSYMVPTGIMALSALPLTSNGKIDEKALPTIEALEKKEYIPPRTEMESVIASLYQEVLGLDHISIDDSFFALGGHSLRAVHLMHRLQETVEIPLSVADVFTYATIASLAAFIDQKKTDKAVDVEGMHTESIQKAEEKPDYPMSAAQRRMYVVSQLNKDGVAYNIPQLFKVQGKVDAKKLRAAFQSLMNRHEILRTRFLVQEGKMIQKIVPHIEADFAMEALDAKVNIADKFSQWIRPFVLDQGPLLRMRVIQSDFTSYVFWDIHHIIADGESILQLQEEFAYLYRDEYLPESPLQYKDVSEWMRHDDLSKDRAYWREEFKEMPPTLDLVTDLPRPAEQDFQGDSVSMKITDELVERLQYVSKERSTTDFVIFCGAVLLLLSRYSLQQDLVIGMPISGRYHPQMEKALGMFVNTLPLRLQLKKEDSTVSLFERIKEVVVGAIEHQRYPYEELVEDLDLPKDPSRNPLFDVLVLVQEKEDSSISLGDALLVPEKIDVKEAKFDLTFALDKSEDGHHIVINYATALFTKESAKRMLSHLYAIFEQLLSDVEIPLHKISAITEAEHNTILDEFISGGSPLKPQRDLISQWENAVKRHSQSIALVDDERCLTYQEVDDKSERLTALLQKIGVGPGDFVALAMERSIEMVLAVLAVLRAGAAYVPIDPSYPEKRISTILMQSQPKVILLGQDHARVDEALNRFSHKIRTFEISDAALWTNSFPFHVVHPKAKDPIYCIFTSGTTGTPKGVVNRQEGVANTLLWLQDHISLQAEDTILFKTNFVFDVSVTELLWWFVAGCRLAVLPVDEEKDATAIIRAAERFSISLMNFVPSMYSFFLQNLNLHPEWRDRLHSLRYLLLAGEALPDALVKESYTLAKEAEINWSLMNVYGPTEASIYATYYDLLPETTKVLIGRPLTGTSAYILQGEELCGIGVPGELVLGGLGLAEGYLHEEGQTQEKFFANPFGDGRLYRTGDRARWTSDGQIDYLGRLDNQVKVRGFRIELGEIDAVLRQDPQLIDCAVVVRPDQSGDMALCAYIVQKGTFDPDHYKKLVHSTLPAYMVPSYFIPIEKIPTNANGKLDRHALPDIVVEHEDYVAPQTPLEEAVCAIYEEVLHIKKVGREDHFFELGGHSLKVMVLMHAVEKELGISLDFRDVYFNASVCDLCKVIESRKAKQNTEASTLRCIPKASIKNYYPASWMQKEVYLAQMRSHDETTYNMPIIYEISGVLDRDRLQKAINDLTKRYALLRTYFDIEGGDIVQKIEPETTIPLQWKKANSEETVDAILKSWITPFDLSQAPLVHAGLVEQGEKKFLLFDMHHLISDGGSLSIYREDLEALYSQTVLAPVEVEYKDFSDWADKQQKQEGEDIEQDESYVDPSRIGRLPYDQHGDSPQTKTVKNVLSEEAMQSVQQLALACHTTRHNVYLLALSIALSRFTDSDLLEIGVPFSLRQTSFLERMPGLLVSVESVLLDGSEESNVVQALSALNGIMDAKRKKLWQRIFHVPKDAERKNTTNFVFSYQVADQEKEKDLSSNSSIRLHTYRAYDEAAKYEVVFSIYEEKNRTQVEITFQEALFRETTMRSLLETYVQILEEITKDKNTRIESITGLSTKQQAFLLDWAERNKNEK